MTTARLDGVTPSGGAWRSSDVLLRGGQGKCQRCRQPVRWVMTRKGKAMPLDVDEIVTDDPALVLWDLDARRIQPVMGIESTGRRCHFETCPCRAKERDARTRVYDEPPF